MRQRGPSGPNHYEPLKQSQPHFEDKKEQEVPGLGKELDQRQEVPFLNDQEKLEIKAAARNAELKQKYEDGLINRAERRERNELAERRELEKIIVADIVAKRALRENSKEMTDAEREKHDRLDGPPSHGNENEMGPNDNEGPTRPRGDGRTM